MFNDTLETAAMRRAAAPGLSLDRTAMPPPDEMKLFFEALGETIVAWQEVEKGLYTIFHRLILSRRKGVTSAAYHSLSSLEARLAMTHAAAHYALSPDLLKKWIKLHGTFRRKKDIRNKVAHFDMGLTKVNKRPVPYLAGKPYDATASIKYPDGNAPRMNRRQLQRFRNDFHSFAQELLRFAARIPAPAKSRETSSR
jgi:hypothetical protein